MRVGLFIFLFIEIHITAQTNWTDKNLFEQKNFIENKGQVGNDRLPNKEAILYTAFIDGVTFYFTKNGYTVSHLEKLEKSKKEAAAEGEAEEKHQLEKKEEHEEKELSFKTVEKFHELKWEGASSTVQVIVEHQVKNYYSYSDQKSKGKIGTIIAHAFTKLIYKEIYPHTDIVFEFPKDSAGIKYTIYLYPGADVNNIQMSFPNEKFNISKKDDLTIHSAFGTITDHSPVSYASDKNDPIKSKFKSVKNKIGFKLEHAPKDKTIIIDPWIVIPAFPSSSSAAFDIDYDNLGNVYVYGGNTELLKYDAAGTLIWSYVPPFGYYGDFGVDRNSNSIYLVEGFNFTGAQVIKINSAATLMASFIGDPNFNEMWRIAFSKCTNQAVIAGGGTTVPSYQSCYLDTNLTGMTLVSYGLDAPGHDVAMLTLDNYGNCYELTSRAGDSLYDNQLVKMPVPALTPITYNVNTNYSFLEVNSVRYYMDGGLPHTSNGYNGLTTFNKYVYSYDSYVLKKWDGPTGNLLVYKRINYPIVDSANVYWGGISADDCGNLFLADSNRVLQYDSTLTLINAYLMPGVITDICLSNTGELYVCGLGFASYLTPTSMVSCITGPISFTTSAVGATCTAPGSAAVNITGGTPPFTVIWNSFPVQYGPNAIDLPPGAYVVTVTDASCLHNVLSDTVIVPALAGAFTSLPDINLGCPGLNNGSINITNSGGISPYAFSWSTTAADTNAIYNLLPGIYSLTVTDGAGCTNVYDSMVVDTPGVIRYSFTSNIKCFNDTTTLTIIPTGGIFPYAVNWTTPIATGASVSGVSAGNFSGVVTDDNGCIQPFNYTLTQPSLFTAFSTSSYNCDIGNFGNIIVSQSGGDGPYRYSWTAFPADTANTIGPIPPGIYTFTVTDSNQCVITLTDTIPVYSPVLITGTTVGTCTGGAGGSITVNPTGGATGSPYQYTWAGFSTTVTNTLSGVGTGTYTVTVNSGLCSDSATFTVSQLPIDSTAFSASICTGQVYTLPSGTLVNSPGTYTDTIRATGGCDSIVTTLLAMSSLTASAGSDVTIIAGSNTSLIASGGTTYSWIPLMGLSCTTCADPIASPKITTNYCVEVSNGICTDSACITVTVEAPCPNITELQVPDAFSPNNDGNNDVFVLEGWHYCIKEFNIIIYDRWGEKVFESENVNLNWDGTFKGKILDPAVFIYYIKAKLINDISVERKGNITLIR